MTWEVMVTLVDAGLSHSELQAFLVFTGWVL